MNAQIEWIGPSALNGEPVALLVKVGANGKLDKGSRSLGLGFAVVPIKLVTQVLDKEHDDIQTGRMGGVYMRAMKDTIDDVCGDSCILKRLRKCYVQHNAQASTEVVKMIRDADDGTWSTWGSRDVVPTMLRMARFRAGDFFRSMIAGSAAALPAQVWRPIAATLVGQGIRPLGYVEEWRKRPDLRSTHMASCSTAEDAEEAARLGWRVFLSAAAEDVGNVLPEGFAMCPGSKYFANVGRPKVGCTDCGLCNGATEDDKRKHIVNIRHGGGDASRVKGLVRKGLLGVNILSTSGRLVGAYQPLS